MENNLISISYKQRYSSRDSNALLRAYTALGFSKEQYGSRLPRNIPRIHDMNSMGLACANILLSQDVPEDPDEIKKTDVFKKLLEKLDVRELSQRIEGQYDLSAKLLLLEIFLYMIILDRGQRDELADRELEISRGERIGEELLS